MKEEKIEFENKEEKVFGILHIPENKIKEIKCPMLIIQGNNDKYFDIEIAEDLYNFANEPKKLIIVRGANHTFTELEHQKILVSSILEWFDKWLK